jgi:predicted small metal-binding protein
MGRKFIDCREIPSDVKCSLALVADSVDEVVDAAVLHAVAVHKEKDTPQLREEIKALIKDGAPPS